MISQRPILLRLLCMWALIFNWASSQPLEHIACWLRKESLKARRPRDSKAKETPAPQKWQLCLTYWVAVNPFVQNILMYSELHFVYGVRDQALSLWSGSTDSKTLDYQRTNPQEYQLVKTHTKETTWIQDSTSPNHQYHPVQNASSKQQIRQKYKPNHQQTELPPHSALPVREKTNKQQKLSTYLTLYEAYTDHWIKLRRAEIKRKKEFNLEAWEKETSITIS